MLVWFSIGCLVLMLVEYKYPGIFVEPGKIVPLPLRWLYYLVMCMGWPIVLLTWALGSIQDIMYNAFNNHKR